MKIDELREHIQKGGKSVDGEYDDVINLPYKKSRTSAHIKFIDREAQFSPFASITTHLDAFRKYKLTSKGIESFINYTSIVYFINL